MSESFIERLLSGDMRTIIITVLALFCLYWALRFFREVTFPMRELIHWMKLGFICLLIYGFFTAPDQVGEIFFTLVDWLTEVVSSFLESDTTQSIPETNPEADSRRRILRRH